MSRTRRDEINILEMIMEDVASKIPWWAAVITAFFLYILFDYISGIKVDGGLLKHPVLSTLIILSNACKIMFSVAFVVGGLYSAW